MSAQTIKIIITAVLLLHGLAHGRASVTLLSVAASNRSGPWIPMRSWVWPSLSARGAAILALLFWFPATLGFIGAALAFWGIAIPGEYWRPLSVAAAILSTLGIVLFSGIWPGAPEKKLAAIDTIIALIVNLAIFVTLLWLQWPPYEIFLK